MLLILLHYLLWIGVELQYLFVREPSNEYILTILLRMKLKTYWHSFVAKVSNNFASLCVPEKYLLVKASTEKLGAICIKLNVSDSFVMARICSHAFFMCQDIPNLYRTIVTSRKNEMAVFREELYFLNALAMALECMHPFLRDVVLFWGLSFKILWWGHKLVLLTVKQSWMLWLNIYPFYITLFLLIFWDNFEPLFPHVLILLYDFLLLRINCHRILFFVEIFHLLVDSPRTFKIVIASISSLFSVSLSVSFLLFFAYLLRDFDNLVIWMERLVESIFWNMSGFDEASQMILFQLLSFNSGDFIIFLFYFKGGRVNFWIGINLRFHNIYFFFVFTRVLTRLIILNYVHLLIDYNIITNFMILSVNKFLVKK